MIDDIRAKCVLMMRSCDNFSRHKKKKLSNKGERINWAIAGAEKMKLDMIRLLIYLAMDLRVIELSWHETKVSEWDAHYGKITVEWQSCLQVICSLSPASCHSNHLKSHQGLTYRHLLEFLRNFLNANWVLFYVMSVCRLVLAEIAMLCEGFIIKQKKIEREKVMRTEMLLSGVVK